MNDIITTLTNSMSRIDQPNMWVKGQHNFIEGSGKNKVCKHCMVGAVIKETGGRNELFERCIDVLTMNLPFGYSHPVYFNDDRKTTHPMVIQVFKNAIEHVKKTTVTN